MGFSIHLGIYHNSMTKGIGIAFILIFSISCSREPDTDTASENSSDNAVTVQDEVIPAPENQNTSQDTVEEKPTLNTAPASLPNSDKPTSNARPEESLFGDPFSTFSGSGTGGTAKGNGMGASNVPKITRTQLSDIDRSPFKVKQSAIIRLQLTIDASGSVMAASVDEDRTHTSDEELLNKVINAVKQQVKYNRVPDAPLMKVEYKVFIEGTEMPVYVK